MAQDGTIHLPMHLSEVTLGQVIDFSNVVKEIDAQIQAYQVDTGMSESRKTILVFKLIVERAYQAVAFFNDMPVDVVKALHDVDEVMDCYGSSAVERLRTGLVEDKDCDMSGWVLPDPVVSAASLITFGQFIDSKVYAQAAVASGQTRWELLHYLCAIYLLREGESYQDTFTHDGSVRMVQMWRLPMSLALVVLRFFDEMNTMAHDTFTVFADNDGSIGGVAMRQHMEQWGWVNFLKTIAKTKVYDIAGSGLNSIDCARAAKLFDVLVDASEERGYNQAASRDMEAAYNR